MATASADKVFSSSYFAKRARDSGPFAMTNDALCRRGQKVNTEPRNISIRIGGNGSPTYKSISSIVWDEIPPLAILTGLNGSGKTQLLELLAYKLSNTKHPDVGDLSEVYLEIIGDSFEADSVAFLPSRWEITGAIHMGLAQMQEAKRHLYQQLNQPSPHDMRMNAKRAQILKMLDIRRINQLTDEQFAEKLPDDFAFMLDEADVTSGLGHVFLAYRMRFAQELENGLDHESARSSLGPAPWDVVNEILQAAEFPYQVVSPLSSSWIDVYKFHLELSDGKTIRPADLSSGEKMLLGVALWLYNSKHHNRFPKLFLLDEPDAHLHPSMTRHFLRVINEVLVEKYGVRTILTTHSPTTVALAPEGSLFEMSRGKQTISRSRSKQATVGLLTSGLVTVSKSTRYVLVEDDQDVQFYDALRDLLTDYGPSRDLCAIDPAPTLVFMPASRGFGSSKVGGGCSVVKQWVEKLDGEPLSEFFRGVIDRDSSNTPSSRIQVIGRYNIENYMLDPFVVYGLLCSLNDRHGLPDVGISQGDEHLIKALPSLELQKVVFAIDERIRPNLTGLCEKDGVLREVTFTSGQKCQYPSWILDRNGHDLLPLFQRCFSEGRNIHPPQLIRSFRRVRMIPVELASLLSQLQGST